MVASIDEVILIGPKINIKLSKSRRCQLLPGTTRQDTIYVDCCVGIQDRRREEDEVSFLHLSFLLIYWLLLVINKPIVL